MSLLEHLEELRKRLIIVVISILAAAVIGFVVARPILDSSSSAPAMRSGRT